MLIALLLFLVIFILPVWFRELRSSKSVLFSYLFVVVLHQVVAVTNAFWFTTLGAGADALTFNRIGAELAQTGIFSFAIGSKFYGNMLGVIYWLFGASHFLGEQLSVLAFALSCIILIKILRQLDLLHCQVPVLLAFGALPTMVLLGSITLRESYQILFFMLAAFFGIKMHLKGGINNNLLFMIMAAFVMGLFHKGLIVYMFFLVVFFMYFSLNPASHLLRVKKPRLLLFFMLPVLLLGLVVLGKLKISGLGALSALANMDILGYATTYRAHSAVARATYGVALDVSSPVAFFYSAFITYFYYLFSPFPWQVGGLLDIYASLEAILRMVLLYYSLKHWRNAYGVHRRLLGLMLVLFFTMTFLWAMGTTNYGTAMRHHMLSWWILVIVGMPQVVVAVRRFSLGFSVTKCSFSTSMGNNS